MVSRFSAYYQKQHRQTAPMKIAYFMSFGNNEAGLVDRLGRAFGKDQVIVCYTANQQVEAQQFEKQGYKIYSLSPSRELFKKTLKVLAQVRWVLCDNYFPLLAADMLHKDCQVIQLWHANGAVKKFGWQDPATTQRSIADQQRFAKVYQRFDYYLVGSDEMAAVFQKSYHARNDQFLPFGFHRSDMFFSVSDEEVAGTEITDDETYLYMPTYRENNHVIVDTLDRLASFARTTGKVVCYKLHPVTKNELSEMNQWPDLRMVEDASYPELYRRVTCLITDYSSVPFDYCLANPGGRLIFYWPDAETYEQAPGINETVKTCYKEEVTHNLDELVDKLSSDATVNLAVMNDHWNQYNCGTAQAQLIAFIKRNW